MGKRSSTILLADSPDEDEDYDDDDEDEDDEPQRMNMSASPAPRRSSSLDKQLRSLARGQQDLALAVGTIAKSHKAILNLAQSMQSGQASRIRKHDPMGPGAGDPAMGGMDDMDDGLGGLPPGGPPPGGAPGMPPPADDQMGAPADDMDGEDRLNLSSRNGGMGKLRNSRAKIMKDDTATSFGEIDDDEPGNRPWDQKRIGEDDTLITGSPGSGPGPLSGTVRKALAQDTANLVISQLQKAGVIPTTPTSAQISKAAVAPTPGSNLASSQISGAAGLPSTGNDKLDSQINKMASGDMGAAIEELVKYDFQAINRLRVEATPGSLMPFPMFGSGYGQGAGFNPGALQFSQ